MEVKPVTMTRWNPLEELATLRESMERLFSEDRFTPTLPRQLQTIWQPAVEVSDSEGEVIVKAELPGVDPKSLEIFVTPDGLTLKGETKSEHEAKGRTYYRRELHYGMFQRTIPLPAEVKSDEAKAGFRNGILEVRMPKSERARPKSVKVEIDASPASAP
jgi:HSP20 family protein